MDLPKLLTAAEVAEYLAVSEATLERWRADGAGPNFIKAGAGIRYPANCVAEYVNQQLQLPSEAEKMRAAATHGMKEAAAAIQSRVKEMQALDKADSSPDPYAVTVGDVGGSTPGIEKFVTNERGEWVKNGTLSQTVIQPAAQPHLLNCR